MWLSVNGDEVIYWRKANQIHNWFVMNIQKGKDDCGVYEVSINQLKDLLETIDLVLKTKIIRKGNLHNYSKKLLPTTSGFFFGSVDYDEDYINTLKVTKQQLTKFIKLNQDRVMKITYSSSW